MLAEKQDDGVSLRIHLENISKKTGVVHEILANAPKLPTLTGYLWNYYVQIRSELKDSPLTAQAVRDFCWFAGVELDLFERAVLKRIEAEYLKR